MSCLVGLGFFPHNSCKSCGGKCFSFCRLTLPLQQRKSKVVWLHCFCLELKEERWFSAVELCSCEHVWKREVYLIFSHQGEMRSWPTFLSNHASLPSQCLGKKGFFSTNTYKTSVLYLISTNLFHSFLYTLTSRKCFLYFSHLLLYLISVILQAVGPQKMNLKMVLFFLPLTLGRCCLTG